MNTLELNVRELSNSELRTIDGGIPLPVLKDAVTVAVAVIGGAYLAGKAVGSALYNLFN